MKRIVTIEVTDELIRALNLGEDVLRFESFDADAKEVLGLIEKIITEPQKQEPDALAGAKTGKWERRYSRPGVYADLNWWCSHCKRPTTYQDAGIFYEYCPHCGAKLEKTIED